jgi:ribonuclease BN (tRNA processing enzyme)
MEITERSGRLVLLGTKGGPAIRPGGPMPTASLLEIAGRRIVVDCGLGVTRSLVQSGVDLRALDLVFVTHLHSDHVLELGPLLHTAWTAGLRRAVRVFGPAGTAALWQGFCASMAFDIATRIADEGRTPLETLVEIVEYTEGAVVSEAALSVRALRVPHPPVKDCFALRFDAGGRSVTFSADTAWFPPLADFARGSDILVHEALLPEGVEAILARTGAGEALRRHLHASHTTAEAAGRIATAAGVGRLVLHHLVPADDPDFGEAEWIAAARRGWDGPLSIGRDGAVFVLPERSTA